MPAPADDPVWFVGVDLAWSSRHPSGLALLRRRRELTFIGAEQFGALAAMAERIRRLPGDCYIAIDAPLAVPNASGARPVDRELTTLYGRFHAGAHPVNRRILRGELRAHDLLRRLADIAILDRAPNAPRQRGRWALETYPHAALVELLRLDRIVKYKRGTAAARRAELQRLATALLDHLPAGDPPLQRDAALELFLTTEVSALAGSARKGYEDRLDALICAYVAAHVWRWGTRRNRVLGRPGSGAVVLPRLRDDITAD